MAVNVLRIGLRGEYESSGTRPGRFNPRGNNFLWRLITKLKVPEGQSGHFVQEESLNRASIYPVVQPIIVSILYDLSYLGL